MILRKRPQHIVAVNIEPRRCEVVRARREWRTWQIDHVEHFSITEAETPYEALQRLNLRPKSKQPTALILFLSRQLYAFHRENYPLALEDRLEETLSFDWSENLLYDPEQTHYFSGPPAQGSDQLVVPIFSLPLDRYDKLYQSSGAAHFSSFTLIPAALAYEAFLKVHTHGEVSAESEIFARLLTPTEVEVHHYVHGRLIDSSILQKGHETVRLFRETLLSYQDEEAGQNVVSLLCAPDEVHNVAARSWVESALPIQTLSLNSSLLVPWVEHIITQERIYAFGSQLHVKPWQPPKIIIPLLVMFVLYAGFATYQRYQHDRAIKTTTELQAQRKQLEAQWKPIEELQSNITKLQEEQKIFGEFDQQGYPVLELLTLLSEMTPEDTWLDYLSLANKELQIRGESASAVKYLSELSKIEGFSNVSFASPVSKNPSSDKERFNVRIQLDVEKLAKTLPSIEIESDKSQTVLEDTDTSMSPESMKQLRGSKKSDRKVGAPTEAIKPRGGVVPSEKAKVAPPQPEEEGQPEEEEILDDTEETIE
jgi:general secretion pathway protein L